MIDLRKMRTEKGMTQDALAREVGVIRQTISNIECGVNRPSPELAMRIAEVLEFNWAEFYTKDEG